MLAEFNKDVSNRLHNNSENIISWQMLLREETTPWETYNTSKAGRLPIASGISPLNSLYEITVATQAIQSNTTSHAQIFWNNIPYTGNSLSLPRALQKQGLHAG
jgi:hypothetical protein